MISLHPKLRYLGYAVLTPIILVALAVAALASIALVLRDCVRDATERSWDALCDLDEEPRP